MARPARARSHRTKARRTPGMHVLVAKGAKRLRSGRARVRWVWKTELIADLRAPPLVEVGADALLDHHEASVESGQRPSQGRLPKLSPATRKLNKRRGQTRRLGDYVLGRTGQTISRSVRLKMRGGVYSAAQTIKPHVEDEGHAIVINRLGQRGVPLYAAKGRAHEAVSKAWNRYLRKHAFRRR